MDYNNIFENALSCLYAQCRHGVWQQEGSPINLVQLLHYTHKYTWFFIIFTQSGSYSSLQKSQGQAQSPDWCCHTFRLCLGPGHLHGALAKKQIPLGCYEDLKQMWKTMYYQKNIQLQAQLALIIWIMQLARTSAK